MNGSTKNQEGKLSDCACCNRTSSEGVLGKIGDLEMQCQALQEYNEELEESRNRYASAFDHSSVGHVILDEKGLITDANLTIASLVEMQVENMIGLPFHVLIIKQEATLFFDHLRRCKTAKARVSTEFILQACSHNTYCVQVISIPFVLLDQQSLCYNTTIIDISHQKRLEQEIQKLDRLNLIGEMAAGIAHEIRNPMTTVHGYLQLFKRKSSSQQEIEDLQLMLEELERANAIITEFLSLAKNKNTDLVLKSINNLIMAIYPLIQAEAMLTGKEIFLELFPHLPEILIDKKEMRQVLFNLVNNGLQAMKRGQITIRTFMQDGNVVLAVEDQGHGIPDEIKAKIGTPFFSTKESGTGLGLAICDSIVQRHHAKLDFKTSPYGTTFFIRFPVAVQGI